MSGDGKRTFFRYSIAADSWTPVLRADGALAITPGNVADGGALTTDGTFIYAFQGKTTAFWRYDIAADAWTVLAPFSAATGQGGALVFVPGLDPQGQLTTLSASRSLVVHRRSGQGHPPARFEHSGQQRCRVAADRDADRWRLLQRPDRADPHQSRRRRPDCRRRRRIRMDVHRRGRCYSRQPDLQRVRDRRRSARLPGGDLQQRPRLAAADASLRPCPWAPRARSSTRPS